MYFRELVAAIESPEAQVEFFRQMRELDIGGFHFGSNIPQTPYRAALQHEHIPLAHTFLADRVQTGWAARTNWLVDCAAFFDKLSEWARAGNHSGVDALGFRSKTVSTASGGGRVRAYDFRSRTSVVAALRAVGIEVDETPPALAAAQRVAGHDCDPL